MRSLPQQFELVVAPRSKQVPLTPLAPLTPFFFPRKLIKEKIWDVSPTFRYLTPLESTKRSLDRRQMTSSFVEFMTNNSFRIITRCAHLRYRRIHPLTISFHDSCFNSLPFHCAPRCTVHYPRFTIQESRPAESKLSQATNPCEFSLCLKIGVEAPS